ncbi:sn-1-specific diacylglycerol lipase ABHD11-like isoform X2 [Bacillus rossius redtenbacheri]|uniref:sn-1-specific diacylglycerol lipase ABHD11-like isoform X2 n=1 Tax=Bacillus rossius redtenbacheri TaxID=93214 RepID=UPI002FDE3AED
MFKEKCFKILFRTIRNRVVVFEKPQRFASNYVESVQPVQMAHTVLEPPSPSGASPVVIMHGLMGSRVNWNSVSRSLCASTGRKIVTVDARNHGDSPHSPDHSYPHMARDIRQLAERLGAGRLSLIGHSMGGRAAMYFALSWPELVERLVVVDICPVRVSPSLAQTQRYLAAMQSLQLDPGLPVSQARRLADQRLSGAVPDAGLRQFLLMNLVRASDGSSYKWRVNLESILRNFDHVTNFPQTGSSYDGPTLFVAGQLSDYVRR